MGEEPLLHGLLELAAMLAAALAVYYAFGFHVMLILGGVVFLYKLMNVESLLYMIAVPQHPESQPQDKAYG